MTDALAFELLPKQSSTPYELANLGGMIEAWPLDHDAVARESDPMRCSADKLPDLFFDRGGTYWNEDWPDAKKRNYIRNLWVYKRLEGTPLGVELYANLEGACVLREDLPPGQSFIMDGVVDPATILALMPQLRLYYYWPDRILPRQFGFIGRGNVGRSTITRGRGQVLGRYPVLWDRGVETPLQIVSVDIASGQAILGRQGFRGAASFIGASYVGKSCLGPVDRPAPIVFDTADPFLETVRVSPPCRRQESAIAPGKFIGRSFIRAVRPGLGSYDRLYLWDPTRLPKEAGVAGRKAFVSATRLGVRRYTQILTIAVPGFPEAVAPRRRFIGQRVVYGPRRKPIHRVMEAIEAARRPGDRLLVKLSPFLPGSRFAPVPAIGDLA